MKRNKKLTNKHFLRCSNSAVFVLLFLLTFNLYGQDNLLIKASILDYSSICSFNDSNIKWPARYTINAGSTFTMQGCRDIENDLGHPPAIIITIENSGTKEAEFPINGLEDVTINSNNKISTSIAFRKRDKNYTGFGSEYTKAFCTKFTGGMTIVLNPGEIVDLVFLFSEASVGDAINIGETSVKIE